MFRLLVPLAFVVALSACAPLPPPGPVLPPGACDADNAAWALGVAATPDVVDRVRVDTHSRDARVIAPGQAVTMDYRGDRVNIRVNDRNAIIGITCG